MKKLALICAVLAIATLPLAAQDAEILSGILEKQTASVTDFAYLVASQLGMECTPFEAYTYCDRFGTFPFKADAEQPVTVLLVSHFLMANYGLKGGIMWGATGSARYAWKELKAQGFWKAGIDPSMVLTGRDLLRAMNRFVSKWPDAALLDPLGEEAPKLYREAILSAQEVLQ